MNKIEINPIYDTTTGKWVVSKHESVIIETDLEMIQKIVCVYHEDNNGSIGQKTLDYIDSLDVQDEEKRRLKNYV